MSSVKSHSTSALSSAAFQWLGTNAKCESTGHVWLKRTELNDGPWPLVHAESADGLFISGQYGRSERRCAYALKKLLSNESPIRQQKAKPVYPGYLSETQKQAIETSLKYRVSAIIGGPGTGKTTIASVLSATHGKGNTLGLSPTGKGADRLSESIGSDCFTIHRLFYMLFGDRENEESLPVNMDNYSLILVDETGMSDIAALDMFLSMVISLKLDCRIVFLGDSGQLPSVGPGRVLDELTLSIPTVKLQTCFRFSDYDIGESCEKARNGILHQGNSENYTFTQGGKIEVLNAYQKSLRYHNNDISKVRVITYENLHSYLINYSLRDLDPTKSGTHPVVCLRNNYRHNVFNGQCGQIDKNGRLSFKNIAINKKSVMWTYAYCTTCHKAQGGQWETVIVWIPSARYISKEWLNTALSRAVSKLIVVIDNPGMVEKCLKTAKPISHRNSLLSGFVSGDAMYSSD